MTFEVGQTIVRRNVHVNGRIAVAEAARVISDDARGVLTWTAPGSMLMHRTLLDGTPTRKLTLAQKLSQPTMLSPTTWRGGGVLILTPPAQPHSVWWFFDPAGTFLGWYINLERPATRWPGGLDALDQALDICVEPDRSWIWKDEDEFAERIGHPLYWTADEAELIRAEGLRMTKLVEAGEFPFDGSYADFRPDPSWEPSTLPWHWDALRP